MQVYFFTRTGRCKIIAESIAKSHGVEANSIDDSKDWSGKLNFVKAGAAAAKKDSIKSSYAEVTDEEIVLIFPIWAGTMPPGVRYFTENVDTKKIKAVAVSAASSLKENEQAMFGEFYEVKGKVIEPPSELIEDR